MHFLNILVSLISVASLTRYAAASLRITADHHTFGGVNYPSLQFLEPEERDEVIKAIVKSHARVIRLFIRGGKEHSDPETELGIFDHHLLDQFDDTLAAIHRISNGKVKVIIAPHDAHAIRGSNDVSCDAYCRRVDGAFLDFYSNEEIKEHYKHRLTELFSNYKSKNFQGAPWGTLKQVIMGVDIQNEPWSGIWPIVAGESWLCDVATHLKDTIGLGDNDIAIITGGISGAQTPDGIQNFPDSAFNCKAVDVIGIHGYYAASDEASAGKPWADIFLPGNTLTARAIGKEKLLLVEEMAYMNSERGIIFKKSAVWDQGNALNYRGIPWLYSHVTTKDEGTSSRISILRDPRYAVGALIDVLKRAYTSRSNFNWSKYLPPPKALSNTTLLALNPFIPEQSDCTFGCLGWLCDAADGCEPDLICKNSVCQKPTPPQPGSVGADCNSKNPCREHLTCSSGTCQPCVFRPSIPPTEKRKAVVAGHPDQSCHLDTFYPFQQVRICSSCNPSTQTCRQNPCQRPADCDADQFCDWGICKKCTVGCLGMKCKSNAACKTGFCNSHGRCDYPGKAKKVIGPGAYAGRRGPTWNRGPKEAQRGPAKVRDEAMRVNIPKEEVKATRGPE
ncbi:glycoside hydrolase family 5 protein, partial [Zopfia rhizophila CBS 207.26]